MLNVLSADIGGTKTLVELNQYSENTLRSVRKRRYISADYADFESIIHDFLTPKESVDIACFAIAGPVAGEAGNQTASVTNLPWFMSTESLKATFHIPNIHFINDFQAMGYAIEHLSQQDIEVLQLGCPQSQGIRAVIGAGTGLGEAILTHNTVNYDVIATEGGHIDFAANSPIELALYQHLHQTYEHVSYERVLSGDGLAHVFYFLADYHQINKDSAYQEIINSSDPAAAISKAATNKTHPIAEEALALFMRIYGAKAGNLALACIPRGGLYISGGIAEKNLSFLKESEFLHAFNAKGRMSSLLNSIPVNVIKNPDAGLIGATQHALTLHRKTREKASNSG